MKHWYVLHTKPHQEQIVAAFLHQRQVESYLPLVRVKPANPRASRTRPYFPCYLFVQADLDLVGVEQLYWTPGLRRLVEFGGQPAEVPNHFMFDLRQRVNQICSMGELIISGVKKGDAVKIVEGPFAGYEALFDLCLPGTERVRVLLTLLEKQHSDYRRPAHGQPRAVPLELNANSIVRVKPKSL